jgi:hypothetical protein
MKPLLPMTRLAAGASLAASALAACSEGSPADPSAPGPGVLFTYPRDGQEDVPLGARILVAFTDPVDAAALAAGCAAGAGGRVTGAFCVVGPDGPLEARATATGEAGDVLQLQTGELRPGASYEVYVGPSATTGEITNLPDGGPLFAFRTRPGGVRGGEPPAVLAVNGGDPAAFTPGSGVSPRFPVTDFATLRLVFSEPIDPATAVAGDSVALVQVDGAGGEKPVEGALLVDGAHLTFDPAADMTPGAAYRLRLSGAIRDAGGEPLAPVEYELSPEASRVGGELIPQTLDLEPAVGDDAFPAMSSLAGAPINTIDLDAQLIGHGQIALSDGSLRVELADPSRFGGPIPFVIRRGQVLASSGLSVALGGEIPSGLDTGILEVALASDATGVITRNPYRAADVLPDDARAPLHVYLTLDLAVTARDPIGNAALNQTVFGVELAGTAAVVDGALAIQSVGAMDIDLLGLERASANLVLGLRTDPGAAIPVDATAPELLATYPADDQDGVPVDDRIVLVFSEPLDPAGAGPGDVALTAPDGAPVPVHVREIGSALVVTPARPLAYGTRYHLALDGALRDLAGNEWARDGAPLGPSGGVDFSTPPEGRAPPVPPVATAVVPGAPCAAAPARCAAEASAGAPLVVPADRPLDVQFSQPIDPATLSLGAGCGDGPVRVERLAGGACAGAVPGALLVRERGLRFVPAEPWRDGQAYRLVLVPGADGACGPGEICGRNGLPLDTDLLGGEPEAAGGPDAVVAFTGAPPTRDAYLPVAAEPVTDANGNGLVDPGEVTRDRSRAAIRVAGTGGIVSRAVFDMEDCRPETPQVDGCTYITADLPVSIGAAQTDCAVVQDAAGRPMVARGESCIPVRVYPQVLLGTSLRMDASAVGLPLIGDLDTGRLVLRLREPDGRPIVGHIIDGGGAPEFVIQTSLYLDAPSMTILGGSVAHDLRDRPLSMSLAGPVSFLPDGRMQIDLRNTAAQRVRVQVTALLGLTGTIDLEIPAGQFSLRLVSRPPRAR